MPLSSPSELNLTQFFFLLFFLLSYFFFSIGNHADNSIILIWCFGFGQMWMCTICTRDPLRTRTPISIESFLLIRRSIAQIRNILQIVSNRNEIRPRRRKCSRIACRLWPLVAGENRMIDERLWNSVESPGKRSNQMPRRKCSKNSKQFPKFSWLLFYINFALRKYHLLNNLSAQSRLHRRKTISRGREKKIGLKWFKNESIARAHLPIIACTRTLSCVRTTSEFFRLLKLNE